MRRLLIALPLVLAGCVGTGTHEAVLKQLDESRTYGRQLEDELAGQQKMGRALADVNASLEKRLAAEGLEKAQLLKDQTALRASVEEMESALRELNRRKMETDARIAEYKNLLARFQSLIDAGKLRVKIVEGRMVVELPTDVLFRSGQATLSKEGQDAIAEVAQLLAEIPDRRFQVEGHTDNVPIATAQYPSNWDLAAARALRVVRTMVDSGMPPERISAASFGQYAPVTSNDAKEGRDSNRRIEIVVVPDLSSLPGFDELNRVSRTE
ncbi:OmpA family protein [Vulgatibacter incomptus]|uniref:Flagellar motor rotation protein MotB n=1 Tax=Vulgatibacter incomptus TaxID=1391653 RepID=A0A0K1P8H8_9BACT|nr:OmpA family protein [Vulgatibacter incomptus]AKU89711.1 Flagellar motor rotation protein MotB [Vulgatibacter incomptus]